LHLVEQVFEFARPGPVLFLLDKDQFAEMTDVAERMAALGVRLIGLPLMLHAHAPEVGQDPDGVGCLLPA
jgi:hypothetical protein